MPAIRAPALYSPELLGLAVELAEHRFEPNASATGEARSRSCGSTVAISSSDDTRLASIGLRVTACAIGQASAAIFASEAEGMDRGVLDETLSLIARWLEGEVPSTFLPRLELLEPARPHRGRHEAILLPWRAALDALSKTPDAR